MVNYQKNKKLHKNLDVLKRKEAEGREGRLNGGTAGEGLKPVPPTDDKGRLAARQQANFRLRDAAKIAVWATGTVGGAWLV